MKQYISKSDYCDALGCMKMLWLEKNKPEVFDRSAINPSSLENGIMVAHHIHVLSSVGRAAD